jgi:hypothetical protein
VKEKLGAFSIEARRRQQKDARRKAGHAATVGVSKLSPG